MIKYVKIILELNHHRLEVGGFGSRLQARLSAYPYSSSTRKSPSLSLTSCVRMYSIIASSVMTPELATENPRAHRCRPQHSLFRWLNCCNSSRDVFPLIRCIR